MKYTKTHRSINLMIFGLMTAGFLALTIIYTFILAPHAVVTTYASGLELDGSKSAAYFLNLGSLFGAFLIVSGFGLFFSIKAMLNDKDEKLVVNSYLCMIAYGYVLTVFLLLNAIWLYSLIGSPNGSNSPAFWIVLCILGSIGAMIAANVPLMKLVGDDNDNKLTIVVLFGFLACTTSLFLNSLVTLCVAASSKLDFRFATNTLLLITLVSVAVSAIDAAALYIFMKKDKKVSLANYLIYGGLATFSAIPFYSGIRILVDFKNRKIANVRSILGKASDLYFISNQKYCTTAIVTGSLILALAIGLCIYTIIMDAKKKKVK